MICKYFLLSCRLSFYIFDNVLWYTNVLHCFEIWFIYIVFLVLNLRICCQIWSQEYLLDFMFSSSSFIAVALIFGSLIHLGLFLVYGERQGSNFILFMWLSSCPSTIRERENCFPIELSWHLCRTLIGCRCLDLFWTFSSVPLVFMFILMPVPHFLFYF